MFFRSLRRHALPFASLIAALALTGCASDEFILEADLPGDFALSGEASYSAPEGSHCDAPAEDSVTRHLFATPGHGERPHRISYPVPLSIRSKGCTRLLSHVLIELDGQSAPHPPAMTAPDISFASLAIRDRLSSGSPGMPKKGARIFDGRCRWLLSTTTAENRVLECRASDINGSWLAGKPGGELQRDELAGRIVRLAIGMAPDVPATAAGQ